MTQDAIYPSEAAFLRKWLRFERMSVEERRASGQWPLSLPLNIVDRLRDLGYLTNSGWASTPCFLTDKARREFGEGEEAPAGEGR